MNTVEITSVSPHSSNAYVSSRFVGTRYELGFSHEVEKHGYQNICYGLGWSTMRLYMILVTPEKVSYEFSHGVNARLDRKFEMPYKEDFYIPKDEGDFTHWLSANGC